MAVINKSNAYKFMRRTNLKEMYIVRYADDFRIFCRTKDEAERTMKAVTQWINGTSAFRGFANKNKE